MRDEGWFLFCQPENEVKKEKEKKFEFSLKKSLQILTEKKTLNRWEEVKINEKWFDTDAITIFGWWCKGWQFCNKYLHLFKIIYWSPLVHASFGGVLNLLQFKTDYWLCRQSSNLALHCPAPRFVINCIHFVPFSFIQFLRNLN